jgi:nucleoside-diphosphate-sugar epimerase
MLALDTRRIALIGGAGFIGHHLALGLAQRGAQVAIIDGLQINNFLTFSSARDDIPNRDLYLRFISERLDLFRRAGLPLYTADARDYHLLSKLITEIQPNVVVQLAAVAHAGKSNKDPFSTFDHSLRTLENALDATRKRIEHFIFFSSSMVYGNFQEASVTEDRVCEPLGIYGALKFAGEKLVIAYNQVFNLPYTIVRPSALYGERCVSRRVGQVFIEEALAGRELSVQGDGEERLDFTYIGDLVNGLINVIENESAKGQVFNLTYGHSRSINEMLAILRQYIPEVRAKYEARDHLMPERGTLSVEKAKQLIGYAPQYPLEKGYARYIEWYLGRRSSTAG